MDEILEFFKKNGIAPTVQNYLSLNYLGDVSSIDDLGPEDRAEIEALIENGELIPTDEQIQ